MTRTVVGLAFTEIAPVFTIYSSARASRFILGLRAGRRGQKRFPAVIAAKVERLSLVFGVESGCFVHGHAADGIFGHGFRFFHGHVSFLVVVVSIV